LKSLSSWFLRKWHTPENEILGEQQILLLLAFTFQIQGRCKFCIAIACRWILKWSRGKLNRCAQQASMRKNLTAACNRLQLGHTKIVLPACVSMSDSVGSRSNISSASSTPGSQVEIDQSYEEGLKIIQNM
jgi:hypothetical protein